MPPILPQEWDGKSALAGNRVKRIDTGAGTHDSLCLCRQNPSTRPSLTVHLVNLTNPMMMKGPIRELIPVGEQEVRVRLPEGTKAEAVRLLAAGRPAKVVRGGTALAVTVPSVLDHEVVAIDLVSG